MTDENFSKIYDFEGKIQNKKELDSLFRVVMTRKAYKEENKAFKKAFLKAKLYFMNNLHKFKYTPKYLW